MEQQRSKTNKNLLSYVLVRRGNWVFKVSVFKNQYVLVIYKHYFDELKFGIKHFESYDNATEFIEDLIKKD